MNPLIPLIMMVVTWSLDTTDPTVQRNITVVFGVVHVCLFAVMGYLLMRLVSTTDNHPITVKDSVTGLDTEMTVSQYDLKQFREMAVTRILLPLAVVLFIFNHWGSSMPLIIQSINNPMMLHRSPLFQIHVLGRGAEKELQRPWKSDSSLPEWLSSAYEKSAAESEELSSSMFSGAKGSNAGSAQAAAVKRKK